MKEAIKARRAQLQELIKKQKKYKTIEAKEKNTAEVNRLRLSIKSLENQLTHFKTNAAPVEFSNGVVVDSSYILAYMKKLPKGTQVHSEINEDCLVLRHNSGSFQLKNNAEHYTDMKLPKGEELLDGLSISNR